MIDAPFRTLLEKLSHPLVQFFVHQKIHPNTLTWMSFFISSLSIYFILSDQPLMALILWWSGRLFDGLDGLVARAAKLQSARGGFLDISLDMLAYSLVAFSFFLRSEYDVLWCAVIVGYVMCITTALSLGSVEVNKDNRSLRLASGLAEAGETGLFYSSILLFPQFEKYLLLIWLSILGITVIVRFIRVYQKDTQ